MFSYPRRAFTLIEVLLAGGLLSLLLLINLQVFQSGMSGWQKVETQGSLLQQIQVAGGRWTQSCTQASGSNLDVDAEAMGLLSPTTSSQAATIDPSSSQLIWRSTRVFYRDATSQEFRQRNLDWPTPSPSGVGIDQIDFGSGKHPLGFYKNGGHVLARSVQFAEFTRQGACWQLRLRATQKRYGREQLEQVEVRFLAIPRNS
ncbi:hypothetical protein JST97_03245 [bacterium]|nr:hypothetical protein [bacterium]